MKGLTTLALSFFTIAAIIEGAVQPSSAQDMLFRRVRFPSPGLRTIQDAIDRLGSDGTLILAPGTYTEVLRVEGKRVHIKGGGKEGANVTEIAGTDATRAVITFGRGGGGDLKDLALRGSAAGVTGEDAEALELKNVAIHATERCVFGSFERVQLVDVEVRHTTWNGVSLTAVPQGFGIFDSVITDAQGAGLYVQNTVPSAGAVPCDHLTGATVCMRDSVFLANKNVGIVVVGGAQPVSIRNSFAIANGRAGIFFYQVGVATIKDTKANGNLADPVTGTFGDGLAAVLTTNVTATDSEFQSNARAGVSSFGSPYLGLRNDSMFCNLFPLAGEDYAGEIFFFDDLGNNECGCPVGSSVCQVESPGLQAPDP